MAEYICREAIIDDLEEEIKAGNVALDEDVWINKGLRIAIRDIKDIKTADVQPMKCGRWIAENRDSRGYADCYNCTNCNCYTYTYTLMKDCEHDYCPNCGARMSEDGDGE